MHFRTPCLLPIALLATVTGLSSLLPAQQTTAWVDLFDGQTLNGWQQRSGTSTYRVEDKAIVGRSTKGSPNSFLCTERFYGDFELQFETKLLHNKLNSGVQIRSNSLPEYKNGQVHGYQVEIDPNKPERMWAGGIYDEGRRGWLYPGAGGGDAEKFSAQGMRIYKKDAWNQVRVEAIGTAIKTWLNGEQRADLEDDMTRSGFIGLQVHGVGKRKDPLEVRWRKLRIQEVETDES